MFVYDAILEALKCGDTSIPCTELRQSYAKLLEINAETGKTFCQEEFEVCCYLLICCIVGLAVNIFSCRS